MEMRFPSVPDLVAQVGMICCWYWDSESDADGGEAEGCVLAASDLVSGDTGHFSAELWWWYYDALGSYKSGGGEHWGAELEGLYLRCRDGYFGAVGVE